MAQAEGAHSAYSEEIATGGNREDLTDIMWDISPTETPGITALGKTKATAISHDWLTDSLEDASPIELLSILAYAAQETRKQSGKEADSKIRINLGKLGD